jgi:uncharacterized membrane protein
VLGDTTVNQASVVWQRHDEHPGMTWRQLYAWGMEHGRHHVGSTVYSIGFAYVGATLPLLLLFESYRQPAGVLLTASALTEEVIRTLVGVIAVLVAVPVTTALCAFLAAGARHRGPAQSRVT